MSMALELVRIQTGPFSVEETIDALKAISKGIGAVVVFLGAARDFSKGETITGLDFEHYPGMAEKRLKEIRERAIADFDLIDMSILHRTGHIDIGEDIVLIAAASAHRKEAFAAAEWAIDELKRSTPIWKRETTGAGEVWVSETP